jgi:two-component system phosphate regulon sensor histidine kinase PhoR
LAIVKHIVNRHRGQLLIESEEGKGTTVSVWLPVVQS